MQIGSKRLARYTAEEILDLANRGNVLIRGWGACVVLRDVPHVVRVRVCAPDGSPRAGGDGSGPASTTGAPRGGKSNATMPPTSITLHSRLRRRPRGPLALRSGAEYRAHARSRPARSWFATSSRARNSSETEASRAILKDKALEAHVRIKLRERFIVGTGVSGVEATANGGKIVLTGMAIHSALVDDASKLAAEIAGVKAVENRMVVVHGPRGL